jgi:hypothetical protein
MDHLLTRTLTYYQEAMDDLIFSFLVWGMGWHDITKEVTSTLPVIGEEPKNGNF